MEAAIYLLPVTLGDTAIDRVLPAYNREIMGDKEFNLFVETISLEDMNDFSDIGKII